jgi:hypothetical protein
VPALVWFLFFPREAAGALGTRHSPRPLLGARLIHNSGVSRRGNTKSRLTFFVHHLISILLEIPLTIA